MGSWEKLKNHYVVLLLSIAARPTVALECGSDTYSVSNQGDVDALYECAMAGNSIAGDIKVTPSANGRLELRNIGAIAGRVVIEHNPSLKALLLDSAFEVQLADTSNTGLALRNLSSLTEISGSASGTFTSIEIRSLPSLVKISLPNMAPAEKLSLAQVDRLGEFHFGDNKRIAKEVEIQDVGLESVDQFFHGGMAGQKISVSGIPKVYQLGYGLVDAEEVSIAGNGNLTVNLLRPEEYDPESIPDAPRVQSLTLSGLEDIAPNSSTYLPITVDTYTARNNNFPTLGLYFKALSNLNVYDNPNLGRIGYPRELPRYSWKNISIRNNPVFEPISSPDGEPSASYWEWPEQPIESLELVGLLKDIFFQPLIKRSQQPGKGPFVTKKFVLVSWPNVTVPFNCTPLNELRRKGMFKGEYSCQGESVEDESNARRMIASVNIAWGVSLFLISLVMIVL